MSCVDVADIVYTAGQQIKLSRQGLEIREMEEWRDIAGYEGLYQVSNLGRVKTMERLRIGTNPYSAGYTRCYKEKVLKLIDRGRYYAVNLHNDGVSKLYNVHRLVGEAFIPPVENKPEIDHINRDCYDNRLENLRWADRLEQNNNRNLSAKYWRANK